MSKRPTPNTSEAVDWQKVIRGLCALLLLYAILALYKSSPTVYAAFFFGGADDGWSGGSAQFQFLAALGCITVGWFALMAQYRWALIACISTVALELLGGFGAVVQSGSLDEFPIRAILVSLGLGGTIACLRQVCKEPLLREIIWVVCGVLLIYALIALSKASPTVYATLFAGGADDGWGGGSAQFQFLAALGCITVGWFALMAQYRWALIACIGALALELLGGLDAVFRLGSLSEFPMRAVLVSLGLGGTIACLRQVYRDALWSEKGWLLYYVFGMVFIQGLVVNHMSVLQPLLKTSLDLSSIQQGQMAAFSFGGYLAASFISGYVTEWLRPRLSGAVAIALMALGAFIMTVSSEYAVVVIGITIFGMGMFWILPVHSSVVTGYFPESRQKIFLYLMATLAGGAMIGPRFIGNALELATDHGATPIAWQGIYAWLAVALLILFTILIAVGGRHLAPLGMKAASPTFKPESVLEEDAEQNVIRKATKILGSGVFNRGALYMLGLIVIFDNLASMNILTWIGQFATDKFKAGPATTGNLMATMAAGCLVGRLFMGSFITGRISDRKLLGISYGLAMVMFMFMLKSPGIGLLFVLYFVMSFFISAQSATTYAIGAEKLKDRAAAGIPIADGIGAIGAMAAPWFMGYLADHVGLEKALWLVPIFGFMLTFFVIGWELVEKIAPKPFVPQLVAICVILWALVPLGPGNHEVVRHYVVSWASAIVLAYLAYRAFKQGKFVWVWILAIVAGVHFPPTQIDASRIVWLYIYVISLVLLVCAIIAFRNKPLKCLITPEPKPANKSGKPAKA